MKNAQVKLLSLSCFFAVLLVIANIIASKVVQVGFWVVPAAVFVYPFTFTITDVISEIWGKKTAKQVVWIGFVSSIFLVGFVQLAIWLRPAPFYTLSESFQRILGSSWRIVIASLTAYIVSQTHDVIAFHFWKQKTKGKYLWLRNNASTMVSQLLDTLIFIPLAFYGIVPASVIMSMILSQYVFKILIAVADTPIVYLTVKLLTGKWEIRLGEAGTDGRFQT